jgi:hypothetical protein
MAQRSGALRRGWPIWLVVAGIVAAAVVAALAAQPAALPVSESRPRAAFAALSSAAIVAAVTIPLMLRRRIGGRLAATMVAGAAVGLGLIAYTVSSSIQRQCTAQYSGRPILIGTELTPLGEEYRRRNPELPPSEVLLDAAGDAERVWTRPSIARCRVTMAATHFLWIPLLVVALVSAALAVPAGHLEMPAMPPTRREAAPPAALRYDAFISYRHGGADADVARQVLEALEADGYTVAIDQRDFAANASFLQEMERAIRESRYTIAIVSDRYLQSGHCDEEAILTKVLDMGDRQRRLIPFVIQQVELPAWLFGIVGIDCTKPDALIDPLDKLKATLGPPLRAV